MKSAIYMGVLTLASVAVFFALVAYLGGYGAMIGACIVAGLVNEVTERTTTPNEFDRFFGC